jgi:hypothetical protein
MSFGVVAAVGAAAVGGAVAAKGAKSAANTQAGAAADATAAQERMFDQQVSLQKPWLGAGENSLNQLSQLLGITRQQFDAGEYLRQNPDIANDPYWGSNPEEHWQQYGQREGRQNPFKTIGGQFDSAEYLRQNPDVAADPYYSSHAEEHFQKLGQGEGRQKPIDQSFGALRKPFGMDDFQKDPGYDFRLNEGRKALEGSAAARGGLFSGAAGKALTRYGQDYGSNEYGKAFDRYNINNTNNFNRLASLSGVGQTSANQTGAAAQNFGNQMGNNIIGAGNAAAAGQVGASNAWNQAIGQGFNTYQNNQLIKSLQAPSDYRYQVPSYDGAEY